MAELNLHGGPIFVDVATDPNFPLLYTRLNTNQISEESPGTLVKNEEVQATGPQPTQEAEQIQKEPTNETTNTSMKTQQDRIRCPECMRFSAASEEQMIRHIRKVHRGENPFQCIMCDYTTYNKAVFEEHVRVHQGIKPFKCSKCEYRSASKKNTKKHELIHRPDNPLKCKECYFIARNPKALESHRVKEHVNKPKKVVVEKNKKLHTCSNCKEQFETKLDLKNHIKRRKHCKICWFLSCSFKEHTTHMQMVHKQKDVKKKPGKLFYCALCKWGSCNKARILLHLIHHPNQTVNEDEIDITILRDCGIMK